MLHSCTQAYIKLELTPFFYRMFPPFPSSFCSLITLTGDATILPLTLQFTATLIHFVLAEEMNRKQKERGDKL